jgi:hypothetical protein
MKTAALLFAWIGLSVGVKAQTPTITLASHGESDYRIVIATNAIASEQYAAAELQKYLERMSGVKLPIVLDNESPKEKEILLGDSQHRRALQPELSLGQLGPDGFILRNEQARLVIAGGKPRGTLNGVYTFLEEQLGVRWFTPELETTPRLEEVILPNLNQTTIPALENRDVFWREIMRDADFAAKHRVNGPHYQLRQKHGGAFATYYPFVHSFDLLVPKALFKEHPEYFPLIKGQRTDGYVQRCLSHPDVVKLAIRNVRHWIDDHPDANIISVSQNDTINNCECAECKSVDEAEGSPAGSLLKFVNAIAESIEKDYPNVRIDTLAYQYTRTPPRTIRPHRNVIVRLCSIECCFAHPLESCPSEANRRFRDDIVAWQPVAPLLYVWDYTPNFAHYQQPFPNFDALQANIRFFVKHGVESIFEQGNYSSGGQGEMGPLRAYLLAKILWNPETDVSKHVQEFLRAYYGQAADQIQAYLTLEHKAVRGQDCHTHIFDKTTACYLTDELLTEGDRLLALGAQVAESEAVRARVETARLPIWYVQIVNHRVTGQAREDLVQKFLAVARKAGVSHISESTKLEDWALKIGAQ